MEEQVNQILEMIKATRQEKRISQQEIANHLGISQDVYSKIERGKQEIRVRELFEIMEYLDIENNLIQKSEPVTDSEKINEILKLVKKHDELFNQMLNPTKQIEESSQKDDDEDILS